jgi:hypothetical protein
MRALNLCRDKGWLDMPGKHPKGPERMFSRSQCSACMSLYVDCAWQSREGTIFRCSLDERHPDLEGNPLRYSTVVAPIFRRPPQSDSHTFQAKDGLDVTSPPLESVTVQLRGPSEYGRKHSMPSVVFVCRLDARRVIEILAD